MKKYKLLRYGRCYLNEEGDLAIGLLHGNRICGYTFAASTLSSNFLFGTIRIGSRIVPNDGNWIEIDIPTFNIIRRVHIDGINGKPTPKGGHVEFSKS